MDRAEFNKLLELAGANAEAAGTRRLGQVLTAEYQGHVSNEQVRLSGQLQVISLSDSPVAVPLEFGNIGLTSILMNSKAAPLGYDKQGRLILLLTAKGTYQVTVEGTAKLSELSSGGMQFGLSLPACVAGQIKLSAEGDLEIHSTVPASKSTYDKQADRTNSVLTIGSRRTLTVVLLGNGRRLEDNAILIGESANTITLTRSHQVMSCLYTVQLLRRSVRQLQFTLPAEWTVTEVTCPSLVKWSITGNSEKTLVIVLRSAKIGTIPLHLTAEAEHTGQSWNAPSLLLVDAEFQRGHLLVNTDEELRVKSEKLSFARRENPATASVAGIVSTPTGMLYFHWGSDWDVDLEIDTLALRRSVKEQQKIRVSPEQVTLTGGFEVTAIDRELFDISFELSELLVNWHLKEVLVNNSSEGFEYHLEDTGSGLMLRIDLAKPVMPEQLANIKVVLQHVPSNWHWPGDAPARSITVPLIRSVSKNVTGHVSVSAVDDLDAKIASAPDGFIKVPAGRIPSLNLPANVQHAYSYKVAAHGRIELDISRRKPRISADAIGLISVEPRSITGDWKINYLVSRASTRKLYLLADKSLGENIKITSSKLRLTSKNIVAPDEKTFGLSSELSQRYNLWLLNLDQPASRRVPISVHYEQPVGVEEFAVPLIRPVCRGQINEQLALQANEELALESKPLSIKEIDAIDLPALPASASRILAAYSLPAATASNGSQVALMLKTAIHENYALPSALATRVSLSTYIDVLGGQRTEANLRVANAGRQFLTFRLPEGADLWSLKVKGRQAKPQRNTSGDYEVSIGRSREPIPIRIIYSYQPTGADLETLELGGIEIPGVEINKFRWNVIPPLGYRVTSQQTKLLAGNLPRPIPACIRAYDLIVNNPSAGSFGSLARVREMAQRKSLSFEQKFAGSSAQPQSLGKAGRTITAGIDAGGDAETFEFRKDGKAKGDVYLGKKLEIERYARKRAAFGVEEMWLEDDAKDAPSISSPSPVGRVAGRRGALARRRAAGVTIAAEGRHTLPVDLVAAPGAGPVASFSGLGVAKLVIGLGRQSRNYSWQMIGFILVIITGLRYILLPGKNKAALLVVILGVSSLLGIWWPATTFFANGAFFAGVCLIPIYIIASALIWLGPKLRLARPLGSRTVTTALFLIGLIAIGGLTETAGAVEPSQQGSQRASARRIGKIEDISGLELPPLIVPYEGDPDKADKSQKVLVPYSRFVELWNIAHPEDPIDGLETGAEISLANVRYDVTIDPDKGQLKLTLTADVKTYGSDWVVLELPVNNLAVTGISIDGKPARWQGVPITGSNANDKARNSGNVIMLPGGTSGEMKLNAVSTPRYFGRRGNIDFDVPPLPAAVMNVTLPQADLELEADGVEGALSSTVSDGKIRWTLPLGMTRQIKLQWRPKAGGGAADRTLSAESNHDIYAYHWSILGVTKISYKYPAGEYDRFVLYLPHDATLTDLQGTNLRDHRQTGEKTIDGEKFKVIEMRLHRGAKKQYSVTARWLRRPDFDKSQPLLLVRAGDVARESGNVTLHAAGGMNLKISQVSGGRKTNLEIRRRDTHAASTRPVSRYYWPYRPFSMNVELSRIVVRANADINQLIRIAPDRIQLLVEATVTAEKGQLFGADFTLPKGYELLSAVGAAVENFHERSTEKGRFLHVKFSTAQKSTTMALVLMHGDTEALSSNELENFELPKITVLDSDDKPLEKQQGRIAVQVATSLDAQTVASRNLKSIVPRTLKNWLDRKQMRRVQFAYRYEVPDISLLLNIRQQLTRIKTETFVGLVIRSTSANYTYRLRYNVSGSPIDHISFSMPAEYAPKVAVLSPAARSIVQSEPQNDKVTWDLTLNNELTGVLDVAVNFSLPIDSATNELALPGIETIADDGYEAIVAIQNISRHEIIIKDQGNLDELPVNRQRELIPEAMRSSLQFVYQSFNQDWSLNLNFKPAKPATRIQALVDLMSITTVIDRSGRCRYEVRLALQNRSEQFLKVEVPTGLKLWSATVASQSVKPVVKSDSPEGQVLIPLVKTSPGGLPYEVNLYLADDSAKPLLKPFNGMTQLTPPAIKIVGIDVMRTVWSLRLPDGYRYFNPGGNMSEIAGEVEMRILNIGAQIEQVRRQDKTLREVAGSATQREYVTQQNWGYQNIKLSTEIKQTQQYLESNRDQVSDEDYERLNTKLQKQASEQGSLVIGNARVVETQQFQATNNINDWLNGAASNPGIAETARNHIIYEKPKFVASNEDRQMQSLQTQLDQSEYEKKMWTSNMGASEGGAIYFDGSGQEERSLKEGEIQIAGDQAQIVNGFVANGDVQAPQQEIDQVISNVSGQNVLYINEKQRQLRNQMGIIYDNRAGRAFQRGGEASEQANAKEAKLSWSGTESSRSQGPQASHSAKRRDRRTRSGGVTITVDDFEQPSGLVRAIELDVQTTRGDMLAETEEGGVPLADKQVAAEQMDAYVAKGTYSLPVSLPQGQIRLDFARPAGDVELTIWAMPTRTLYALYGTAAVLVALALLLGGIKLWPKSGPRMSISKKRGFLYLSILILTLLLLGFAATLIAVLVIVAIEARRSAVAIA
ncbi:MAG: hypothetical protein ACYSWP_04255 [Planctomycetota bacterium]